jgi:hypothetical protein
MDKETIENQPSDVVMFVDWENMHGVVLAGINSRHR